MEWNERLHPFFLACQSLIQFERTSRLFLSTGPFVVTLSQKNQRYDKQDEDDLITTKHTMTHQQYYLFS